MGVALEIGLFRHGESFYRQGETSLDKAYDLTEKGISTVRDSAREFCRNLPPSQRVVVYSSPFGRTLHSALIIAETLEDLCQVEEIKRKPQLTEVHGFQWKLFDPLVRGGNVEFGGEILKVDAQKTNPERLSGQDYFMRDLLHHLSEDARRELPQSYLNALACFEKFSEVTERMRNFLKDLYEIMDSHAIIVTHEALVYDLLDRFSHGKAHALSPGDYLHLQKRDLGLYLKKAGRLTGKEIMVL